jgi:hypothetical protein
MRYTTGGSTCWRLVLWWAPFPPVEPCTACLCSSPQAIKPPHPLAPCGSRTSWRRVPGLVSTSIRAWHTRKALRGFPQSVRERYYIWPTWMRDQHCCNQKHAFFRFLQQRQWLLAVFIELQQRFETTHKVKIGAFTKLHPFDTLMEHLCVFILSYLSTDFLSVHDVLQICVGRFQLLDRCLKLCRCFRPATYQGEYPR